MFKFYNVIVLNKTNRDKSYFIFEIDEVLYSITKINRGLFYNEYRSEFDNIELDNTLIENDHAKCRDDKYEDTREVTRISLENDKFKFATNRGDEIVLTKEQARTLIRKSKED